MKNQPHDPHVVSIDGQDWGTFATAHRAVDVTILLLKRGKNASVRPLNDRPTSLLTRFINIKRVNHFAKDDAPLKMVSTMALMA